MIPNKTQLLNRLFLEFGKREYSRYYSSKGKIAEIQQRKLLAYIRGNSSTAFGKDYDFKNIKDYATFIAKVPVIEEWAQIEKYIKRIEKGEQNVLCKDKIDAFEETSGSTGFSKLIPYNKALKREFQQALQVWMLDLYATVPASFAGTSYWSLSPVLKETRYTKGGIRIGLQDDAEYFNPFLRYFLSQIMAVNGSISKIKEPYDFYLATLKQLLLEKNLSFISVWSPTFFLQLDDFLKKNLDLLLQEIMQENKQRYEEIMTLVQGMYTWKDIWPGLACISCWTDAQASAWIPQVKKIAGDVPIQPKGLLSTEAVISIPIKNPAYSALAYQSHFFEFRNLDDFSIHLAHQLQLNAKYEVIVTTAGGLYRYATKDVVQVKGFYEQIPLLKFLGRHNRTSDLVGEKVSEIQVNEIINKLVGVDNCDVKMMFVKPEMSGHSALYTLYIEAVATMNDQQFREMTKRFEQMLCQNPYYQQALNTGQLKAMQHRVISTDFKERLTTYYREKKVIKDGNIKLPTLFLEHELKDLNFLL